MIYTGLVQSPSKFVLNGLSVGSLPDGYEEINTTDLEKVPIGMSMVCSLHLGSWNLEHI